MPLIGPACEKTATRDGLPKARTLPPPVKIHILSNHIISRDVRDFSGRTLGTERTIMLAMTMIEKDIDKPSGVGL